MFGLIFGLSLLELVLTGVIGGVALYYFVPKLSVSRTTDSIRAQVGKVGRIVASQDPVAMAQQAIDDAAQEIETATRALEENGKLSRSLDRQIKSNERDLQVYEARIQKQADAGNRDKATSLIMEKQRKEKDLTENKIQYEQTREMYNAIASRISAANDRISRAKTNAQQLQAKLNMSRVMAATSTLNTQFNGKFASLDKLGEAEAIINEQIDANLAKVDAANDLGFNVIDQEIESEDRALAEAELEKYMKKTSNGQSST